MYHPLDDGAPSSAPAPTATRTAAPERAASNAECNSSVDWNRMYQEVLESESADREEQLAMVRGEFEAAARAHAKIIVDEMHLPPTAQTHPPSQSMGGVAGGDKYVVDGMLLKFARDTTGLYGGDAFAGKAAAHELLGAEAVTSAYVPGLGAPLLALVDYSGFRLVAAALVPIVPPESLVHGSSDAGVTVHQAAPESATGRALEQLGVGLNLAEHAVTSRDGSATIQTRLAADVEVHVGTDGRTYVLDTARLFPPDEPVVTLRGSHLYRLLRPELVSAFPHPLSPDAFRTHNARVRAAVAHLRTHVIPAFARELHDAYAAAHAEIEAQARAADKDGAHASRDVEPQTWNELAASITSLAKDFVVAGEALRHEIRLAVEARSRILPTASEGKAESDEASEVTGLDLGPRSVHLQAIRAWPRAHSGGRAAELDAAVLDILEDALHEWGINVRYLGAVAGLVEEKGGVAAARLRRLLLTEMVSRTLKVELREIMRDCGGVGRDENELRARIVDHFNLVLGTSRAATTVWARGGSFVAHVAAKYPMDVEHGAELRTSVDLGLVFARVQAATGIHFTEAVNGTMVRQPMSVLALAAPFKASQVASVTPRTPMVRLQMASHAKVVAMGQRVLQVADRDLWTASTAYYPKLAPDLKHALMAAPDVAALWFITARFADQLGADDVTAHAAYARARMLISTCDPSSSLDANLAVGEIERHYAHFVLERNIVLKGLKLLARAPPSPTGKPMGRLVPVSDGGSQIEWLWNARMLECLSSGSSISFCGPGIEVKLPYRLASSGRNSRWIWDSEKLQLDASSHNGNVPWKTTMFRCGREGDLFTSADGSVSYTFERANNKVLRAERIIPAQGQHGSRHAHQPFGHHGRAKPFGHHSAAKPFGHHSAAKPFGAPQQQKLVQERPWQVTFRMIGRVPLALMVLAIEIEAMVRKSY
ncbi:uncharacterized protein AMSG_09355 [Thecamonas trahens ATCC 50062]|uniref:Clu domain-containing protein n=1 Tax=Thecamonas trahens ATCC 50062 TaxID=461836 RepID=A0A0L0DLF1_THETB|nr:hypothetical protein AMSG_09355 [Thecamonas trahens ATCC 50062]KNC53060.1 hypothetical protein AMSG_09355 [Thecamonas trahens ATCC 50062]|eukprot:XP_013754736.1 hypothetical protein AMSG_09355 [Thecamonas trahens ATCC 50062]